MEMWYHGCVGWVGKELGVGTCARKASSWMSMDSKKQVDLKGAL